MRAVVSGDIGIFGARSKRTWFWMRSLTRSMGAAAVFETAAETPPTIDKVLAAAPVGKKIRQTRCQMQ